jgi:hypothetical protein
VTDGCSEAAQFFEYINALKYVVVHSFKESMSVDDRLRTSEDGQERSGFLKLMGIPRAVMSRQERSGLISIL